MDESKLKARIGANIASYRKALGMTQAELAEKVNYSDKAISKWERGESVPDVVTLVQIAEQFNVTVNDLLADPDALPEDTGAIQKAMDKVVSKTLKRKADKGMILLLSSILVWFVSLLVFVVLSSAHVPYSWLAFFYAVPVNAIVLLSLRSAWHDFRWNRMLISIIVWGCLASIHFTLMVFLKQNLWKIYLLGIPGQLAIFAWFSMIRGVPEKEEDRQEEERTHE